MFTMYLGITYIYVAKAMNLEKLKYLIVWNRGSTSFPSLAWFVYAGSTLNVQIDIQSGTYMDQRERQVKYSDLISKELILFPMAVM
jgi:hypothetical protein